MTATPTIPELSGATISENGLYRYRLWRTWDPEAPTLVWVMLNPSRADATTDDHTIRRCIEFARRDGFGRIEVVNLFAFRSPHPSDLRFCPDPEGPYNVQAWDYVLRRSATVVAAWGATAENLYARSEALIRFQRSREWLCLGRTKSGAPRHPARLRTGQPFEAWW